MNGGNHRQGNNIRYTGCGSSYCRWIAHRRLQQLRSFFFIAERPAVLFSGFI